MGCAFSPRSLRERVVPLEGTSGDSQQAAACERNDGVFWLYCREAVCCVLQGSYVLQCSKRRVNVYLRFLIAASSISRGTFAVTRVSLVPTARWRSEEKTKISSAYPFLCHPGWYVRLRGCAENLYICTRQELYHIHPRWSTPKWWTDARGRTEKT